MSKFAVRIRICSAVLAAALHSAASGNYGSAYAQVISGSDVSDTSPEVSSDDFGGTPAGVASVESPSSGSKGSSKGSSRSPPRQPDQTNARQAVERGEVRPFGWLLKKLKKAVPGDVVKVRLKRHRQEFWIYDVTVLNASGRYVLVSLNAATGAIISSKYR